MKVNRILGNAIEYKFNYKKSNFLICESVANLTFHLMGLNFACCVVAIFELIW